MSSAFRIGIIQNTPIHLAPFENWRRVKEASVRLAASGADLILLPELWATGPLDEGDEKIGQETPRLVHLMEETAEKLGVTFVGTLPEPDQASEGRLFNATFVTSPGGTHVPYRKIHLFAPLGEDRIYSQGREPGIYHMKLRDGKIPVGFLTCFDLRFPELARHLAFQGIRILLVSALWPRVRKDAFIRLLEARAIENQGFVAAANAWGEVGGVFFGGESRILDPTGEVIAKAEEDEDAIIADVNPADVEKARKAFVTVLPPGEWLHRSGRKILAEEGLVRLIERRAVTGQKMVFTNGCFDLLHAGHVDYLEKARSLGDFLVVGLNSDASVRAIKGEGRPVTPEGQRARILAALECVDAVVIFDAPTPIRLIEALCPEVLVKGADWKEEEIAGADYVKSRGGKVVRIPFEHDVSTSRILYAIGTRSSKS